MNITQTLAKHCQKNIQTTLATKNHFNLAVSGGSTPIPFFKALAKLNIPWQHVTLWWCDERCVLPDHPDSNYKLVKDHLLAPLKQQKHQPTVQRLKGEASDLYAEAKRYSNLLKPLDYAVLGMGDDGHTASLFPGSVEPAEHCFVTQHPEGASRLTLSSYFLNQSRVKTLLITGIKKQETLQQAQKSQNSLKYPILRIIQGLQIFSDTAETKK